MDFELVALSVPAPAKLNLFLHVVGRRGDGYHNLQTVFQFIDLADRLDFELREEPGCELLGDPCGIPENQNLIVRAAKAMSAKCSRPVGVRIRLKKRIPLGAGLGGGSSDAATTLLSLNRLWECGLQSEELANIGVSLGADVPVFLMGSSSWAEGIGERLQPITLREPWYLLVYPGVEVNTAAIFADPELTRNSPPITMAAFLQQGVRNDCEPVVRRLCPDVDDAMKWLEARAPARLSGTGSCVFASFPGRRAAEETRRALPGKWSGYVCRGMNRSSAHIALMG